jgi:hypothetical protein
MRSLLASVASFFFLLPQLHAADAKAVLKQALEAQGGEQKLRAIRTISWEAVGYRNELEESERPEGPYVTEFDTASEVHDWAGHRYRSSVEASVYPVFRFTTINVADATASMREVGGAKTAGTPDQLRLIRERMALSPERLLVTALDAPDVHAEADRTLQSVPQQVIVFTLDGAPVRIFLNAYTHLPTAMDYSGPLARSGYFSFLGDNTMRTWYSMWWLAKGGIHLPMQWNTEGGVKAERQQDQMYVIRKLEIDGALDEAKLEIPADVRAKFNPNAPPRDLDKIPLNTSAAKEIAPGIVFIPGSWNATLVKQEDGVVILEAPISPGYTAQVIAEARRRFPGVPVKGVITTSDSWPHLAGVREAVAEGIPVYALDLNEPILRRVIDAPYSSRPDELEKHRRPPVFHFVHDKMTLGGGANRMEIYAIHGETSERQMMVYFPQHQLLYGSDPFQRNPDGSFFYPQTVSELTAAVAREHLAVREFFMMHIEPTPWAELGKALEAAAETNSPDGTLQ